MVGDKEDVTCSASSELSFTSNELTYYLQYLTDKCLQVSGAGAASLFLADPNREGVDLIAASGYYRRILDKGETLHYEIKKNLKELSDIKGIGLTTYVASLGRKLHLSDVTRHISHKGKADDILLIQTHPNEEEIEERGKKYKKFYPSCTQLVAFPLMDRTKKEGGSETVIGVLKVEKISDDEDKFTPEDIKQFESICEIAELTLTLYWYNTKSLITLLNEIKNAYNALVTAEDSEKRSNNFLEKIYNIFKSEVAIIYKYNRGAQKLEFFCGVCGLENKDILEKAKQESFGIKYHQNKEISERYEIIGEKPSIIAKQFVTGEPLLYNSEGDLKKVKKSKFKFNNYYDGSGIIVPIKIPPKNDHYGLLRIETIRKGAFNIFHQCAAELLTSIWAVNIYETIFYDELFKPETEQNLSLTSAIKFISECKSIPNLLDTFIVSVTIDWGAQINRCLIFSFSLEDKKKFKVLGCIGNKGAYPSYDYPKKLETRLSLEAALTSYRETKNYDSIKFDSLQNLTFKQIQERIDNCNEQSFNNLKKSIIKSLKSNTNLYDLKITSLQNLINIIGVDLLLKEKEDIFNDNKLLAERFIYEILQQPNSKENIYLILADNTFIADPATSPSYYGRFFFLYTIFKQTLSRISNELVLTIIRDRSTRHELGNVSKNLNKLSIPTIFRESEARKFIIFKASVFAQNFNQLIELSLNSNASFDFKSINEIIYIIRKEIYKLMTPDKSLLIVNINNISEKNEYEEKKFSLPLIVLQTIILLLCTNSIKHGLSDKGNKYIEGINIDCKVEVPNKIEFIYSNIPNNNEKLPKEQEEFPITFLNNQGRGKDERKSTIELINELLARHDSKPLEIINNTRKRWSCKFYFRG